MNMYGTANYRERFCELYQKNSRKANDDRIWELVGTKLSQGHFALYESAFVRTKGPGSRAEREGLGVKINESKLINSPH